LERNDAEADAELARELELALPADLPRRAALLAGSRRHAQLVLSANERLNLTRIVAPRDVAVKHVLDSVLPWRRWLELAEAQRSSATASSLSRPFTVVDLGSGAGWPGVPLALLLPDARVTLVESTGKKAAFLEQTVRELGLANVAVANARAEEWLAGAPPVDVVTARAVGSARDLLRLLKAARGRFRRLVLYKGAASDAELELAQAIKDAQKLGLAGSVTFRGELPGGAGARSLLEFAAKE
jgi:16S rRNA (guanine527-N7)-methyltransferase